MPYLPVDTAVVVEVGPLIDDTDFKSLEEAIAYDESNMDVDLLKKSATSLTKTDITLTSGGTSDWTHKGSGVYEMEITQAQNDTEGSLRLVGLCDGVLPFESPVYTVVPQVVYNALVAGLDKLDWMSTRWVVRQSQKRTASSTFSMMRAIPWPMSPSRTPWTR